ncbi:MAG TPA: hypothetical protein VH105_20075 [Burkholderiales bacterium]|jgi:protein TonB|nr:hypothetical protein [Burkholderiales bacterium]
MASSITANTAWERGRSWRVPVRDLPWRRLPWILPFAVAFWVLALWAFGRFITSPAPPPEPPPMEARLIELPPELPPEPPPAPPPTPEPPPPPQVKPPPAPPVMPKAPPPPQARLAQEPPTPTPPAPVNPQPAPPPTPAPPPPPAPPSTNPAQGRTGAYAIVKPAPEIPPELAEEAARYSVAIRFSIAADGSAQVELNPPTPNPRLNRIYLDTYKAWKFFPATENGQPVASTQTIRLTVSGQ